LLPGSGRLNRSEEALSATKVWLKNLVKELPAPLAQGLAKVPYELKLGRSYCEAARLVDHSRSWNEKQLEGYLIERLNHIVQFAQSNFPFYRDLYGSKTITVATLEDFAALPIIDKPMARRLAKETSGYMQVNTGGTSGEPLSLWIDKSSWAREWAHMHSIWSQRGYKQSSTMLTMLGKDLGTRATKFNAVHNEVLINPYIPAQTYINELLAVIRERSPRFMQSYPSSAYNFFREVESSGSIELITALKTSLKTLLLSSEFPLPYMRDYFEKSWGLTCISWYGHSEMCVLAEDINCNNEYTPLQTYGYVEESAGKLLGTSMHNFDMPLIRYDTGDCIEGKHHENGVLHQFSVQEGREGDYILDEAGRNIPATALIFGRHHAAFDLAKFVQFYQPMDGELVALITGDESAILTDMELEKLFNFENVDVKFGVEFLQKPLTTARGKAPLLVSKLLYESSMGE